MGNLDGIEERVGRIGILKLMRDFRRVGESMLSEGNYEERRDWTIGEMSAICKVR